MKNKFIVVMLLIVFGYKNSVAQITQPTIKPQAIENSATVNVNTHQYSVDLTLDSISRVRYAHYFNLYVTGMPNQNINVRFTLYADNRLLLSESTLGCYTKLDVNGIAVIKLNRFSNAHDIQFSMSEINTLLSGDLIKPYPYSFKLNARVVYDKTASYPKPQDLYSSLKFGR